MKKFLLSMLGALIALPGIARDFTYEYEGQTLTYTVIDEETKTCETRSGNPKEALVIPSVAKDGDVEYVVTSIGRGAFYRCFYLTSVTIPNSVTSIGVGAFSNCSGLTSVTIPNSVTSIGEDAFDSCSGLKTFTVEDGQNLIAFGKNALLNAPIEHLYIGRNWSYSEESAISTDIISVEIGNSVTELQDYAFYKCNGLTSVTIGNSVTSIGERAFYSCSGLTSVTIPNSVITIGNHAFFECSGLTSMTVGNSVTSIGKYAFFECSGLTSVIIPSSVTSIGNSAFSSCSGLKTFTVEDGQNLIAFGEDAINYAPIEHLYIGRNWSYSKKSAISSRIKSVEIGNSVTELPDYAFSNCSGLTSVIIPCSVTTIGENAFSNCSGLEKSAYPSGLDNPFPKGSSIEYPREGAIFEDGFIYGPEKKTIYFAPLSFEGEYVIPESVTEIGASAFSYCSGLTSVIIPDFVTTIGERAFSSCSGLTSVIIPNFVTTIGERAFSSCSGLTSVIIPNFVTTIGERAFSSCSGLTSVTIPCSVTTIGENAFSYCSGLKKSAYPSGLKNPFEHGDVIQYPRKGAIIEDGFVYGPEKKAIYFAPLSFEGEYVIPNTVSEIGSYAFEYCTGLASVTIGNSVTSIGNWSFSYCSGLTSVIIPNSVTSIGNSAFYGCTGMKKSAYPSGLEYPFSDLNAIEYPRESAIIEDGFIYGPEKKTIYFAPLSLEGEYVIPNSVTEIGRMAFRSCSRLNSMVIPNSVTSIGNWSFSDCSELTSVTIGNSVTSIGNWSFSYCSELTSVTIPNSVTSIGEEAFAGNSKLASIIMGHNVRDIGPKAFDRCPAQTVSITAQTPPNASDDTFSDYGGNLYLQGQQAADAYERAKNCWNYFNCYVMMIEPTEMKVEGDKTLNGKPGDTFQLKATLYPEDVTLPQVFWRSTNPDIAIVDATGLVSLRADMSDVKALAEGDDTTTRSCKIIAESLYADGPVAEFTVNDVMSGIVDVTVDGGNESGDIDFSAPAEIYNLQGVRVSDSVENLANGIYIVRQGNNVTKIVVK